MAAPSPALRRPAPAVRAGAGVRLLRTAVFTAVCVLLAAAGHTMASGTSVPAGSLALGWLGVFAVVAPLAGRERRLPGITALLALGQLALHVVFSTGQMCAGAAASSVAAVSSAAPASAASAGHGSSGGLLAVAARLVCGGHAATLTPGAARQIVLRAGLDPATAGGAAHLPGVPMAGMPTLANSGAAHGSPASLACMLASMLSLPMLLGHLVAAVIAGLLLRRGEAALWRLIRLSMRSSAGLTALLPAALRRAWALMAALAGAVPCARRPIRGGAWEAVDRHRTVWLRHCLAGRGPPVVALAA
ncbi:hypothetical protein SAMN05216223_105268 [Actinacidiphila yanglinensis]|uniref:Integral membrane protein n=1 Tax=Actinacidiphila yanglinensis TaxID=310779 RepID=A0A1H6A9W5_9ACTN|nr:hypothetical protein [Actinacidiphila yanglinensis]SEG45539.1 hypothetical protein SAMN05216223_105268 [Actinacidiphila yanglinensis]